MKPRDKVFWPKTGDWCVAVWKQDGVAYKCKILRTLENGDYQALFPGYGEGEVSWRRVYENLSDVPQGTKYEHGLYEEFYSILHKQMMGESRATANETMIFTTIDNEEVNKEITRQKANEKSAIEARNRAIIFEAESTSEEEEMEEYQGDNEDSSERDHNSDVIIEDSEDDGYEDEDMMQIVVENIRSLEGRNYTSPQILEELKKFPPRRPFETKWQEENVEENELEKGDIVNNVGVINTEERELTDLGRRFRRWFGMDIDEVPAQVVDNDILVRIDENETIHESQTQVVKNGDDIADRNIDEDHEGEGVKEGTTPTNEYSDDENLENEGEEGLGDNIGEEEDENFEMIRRNVGDIEEVNNDDVSDEEFFSANEEGEVESTEEPEEIEIRLWKGSIGSYNAPKYRAF